VTTALEVADLEAGYGHVPVLRKVSLRVETGQIVALFGRNGAGKSTLLQTISGIVAATGGRVTLFGDDVTKAKPSRIVRDGLQHVAEGHRVFRQQTVQSNLSLGLWTVTSARQERKERLDYALDVFPELGEKLSAAAGTLSGGQQQMLAIAQALVARPRVLTVDEPSLGLAPVVLDRVFGALARLRDDGITILLVEQAVARALEIADYGYVLHLGAMRTEGTAAELNQSEALKEAYLGAGRG
jgi:branched-chain amino acid transport system ATP-binding protein